MGLDRGIPASSTVAAALAADLEGADLRFYEWVQRMSASQERPWERYNSGVGPVMIDSFTRAIERAIFRQGTPMEIAEQFLSDLSANAH